MEGARFVGFHEARPERAEQVSHELGVRAFDDVSALIDECDALTIVVPTPAHHAVDAWLS